MRLDVSIEVHVGFSWLDHDSLVLVVLFLVRKVVVYVIDCWVVDERFGRCLSLWSLIVFEVIVL